MRDAVENLARAYIDIKREGCVQFDDMLITVHCNPKHDVAVEVRLKSMKKGLYGQNKDTKDAITHCQDIYRHLRECMEMWEQTMNIKRR